MHLIFSTFYAHILLNYKKSRIYTLEHLNSAHWKAIVLIKAVCNAETFAFEKYGAAFALLFSHFNLLFLSFQLAIFTLLARKWASAIIAWIRWYLWVKL